MRAPAEAAYGVAGVSLRGEERSIQSCATHGVVHNVEALAVAVLVDVLGRTERLIVDRCRAVAFDDGKLILRNGRKHRCSKGFGNLHHSMPHATGAGMNQYGLPFMD